MREILEQFQSVAVALLGMKLHAKNVFSRNCATETTPIGARCSVIGYIMWYRVIGMHKIKTRVGIQAIKKR